MLGLAGGGMLTVFFLKEIPMHTATDNTYGLQEQKQKRSKTSSEDDLENDGGITSSVQAVGEDKAV